MANYIYDMVDTWNNGATIFTAIKMNVTNTASASASMLLDLQIGGTSIFNVRKDGNVFINSGGNSANMQIETTANTNATLAFKANASIVGYVGRVSSQFGIFDSGGAMILGFSTASMVKLFGTSASFPALKRSSTAIQARLADDSAFAPIQGKLTTDNAYAAGAVTPTGTIVLYDSAGNPYRVPCLV